MRFVAGSDAKLDFELPSGAIISYNLPRQMLTWPADLEPLLSFRYGYRTLGQMYSRQANPGTIRLDIDPSKPEGTIELVQATGTEEARNHIVEALNSFGLPVRSPRLG